MKRTMVNKIKKETPEEINPSDPCEVNEEITNAELEPLNPEASIFRDKKTKKIFGLNFDTRSGKQELINLQEKQYIYPNYQQ